MSETEMRFIGAAVSGFFFLVSMVFSVLCWRRYVQSAASSSVRVRLQTRAESLAWISWANLALQAFVVALGLSIARADTFLGVAIMIGFIVAILAVGYRQALRMTFFLYARADALFMLERDDHAKDDQDPRRRVAVDTDQLAKLVTVLSPEGNHESEEGPHQPLLAAAKSVMDTLKK
jgi:membrane protein implicated in regulation of membrane protease activity